MKERRVWFPAKRYGWGWGMPTCWQGWVVVAAYVASVTVSAVFLGRHTGLFAGATIGLSAVLICVCWLKGEPPKWRWGG